MRGCQCEKSLWLYKNHFDLRDVPTEEQEAIFFQGTDIGMLARQLFPPGADATPKDHFHYREAVANTAKFIARGYNIIFEAAFQYEGVMCAVDVLVKVKDKWYAYEIKSSTSVKKQFYEDAALQYYVITNAGLLLEDMFVVHLNNRYIRCGELDLKKLFIKHSVKEEVQQLQQVIEDKVNMLKEVISKKDAPIMEVGEHCKLPYICDFHSYCHPVIEEEVQSIDEVEVMLPETAAFINSCTYPLSFLYFESYMLACPDFDGHWPYRQVPFIGSFQTIEREGEEPVCNTFLAPPNEDPCRAFLNFLLNVCPEQGSIIVCNEWTIKAGLKELKEDYPEYSYRLDSIISRLEDILKPFKPGFHSKIDSFPILRKLSTDLKLVQECDELVINNASAASTAFFNMKQEREPGKRQMISKQLESFSSKTLSTVKRIFDFLEKVLKKN
jgi:hypothetical protein